MDFAQVFRLLAAFLEREEACFALVGGLALQAHGVSRLTSDLDLVTESEVRPSLVAFLEREGWESLHVSAGYSNHLHADPARGRVGIVYVEGERNRSLFTEAVRLEVLPGLVAPVVRPEHLIAMKVVAMKNDPRRALQEISDIQELLRRTGAQPAAVGQYFERHGLLDRFDQILRTL